MKKNIVFSTTRQWNPGDEFILMGCINLLKQLGVDFNVLIYNRNPQIQSVSGIKKTAFSKFFKMLGIDLEEKYNRHFDNSVNDHHDLSFIDAVVFAGSPNWYGQNNKKLYKVAHEYKMATFFMGCGLGEKKEKSSFSKLELEILTNAKAITVRDENTYNLLRFTEAKHLPCPALFSSLTHRNVVGVKKIGLIFATEKTVVNNNISECSKKFIDKLYKALIDSFKDKYDIEFVAHYIDEVIQFKKDYPNYEIYYSYCAKDYIDIYSRFDLVIGSRVHGIGMTASLGIPGIMIAHDMRSDTVKGFLADTLTIDMAIEDALKVIKNRIKEINVLSSNLIEHKNCIFDKYDQLLRPLLKEGKLV